MSSSCQLPGECSAAAYAISQLVLCHFGVGDGGIYTAVTAVQRDATLLLCSP
jgi:hypothetical protein